jgi:hypothetical protein
VQRLRRVSVVVGPRYYNRGGKEIDLQEWLRLLSDEGYRILKVASGCGRRVSTIWLGLDHGHSKDDPPIIFETMMFKDVDGQEGGSIDSQRYSTEEQALKGHEEMVQQHVYILDRLARKLREADEAVDPSGEGRASEAPG